MALTRREFGKLAAGAAAGAVVPVVVQAEASPVATVARGGILDIGPCMHVFMNHECKYTGSAVECDHTFERCKELGNSINFGGPPISPYKSAYGHSGLYLDGLWCGHIESAGTPGRSVLTWLIFGDDLQPQRLRVCVRGTLMSPLCRTGVNDIYKCEIVNGGFSWSATVEILETIFWPSGADVLLAVDGDVVITGMVDSGEGVL